MLAGHLTEVPQIKDIDAICPVPLHRRRQAKRGFNQSEIIAEEVAAALDLECFPEELVKVRANRDQIGLTVAERFRNVQGVYEIADDFELAGRTVLLIDDVTTSGATLNAAAVALKQAGVAGVAAATIAVATDAGLDYELAQEYLVERT